MNIFSWADSKIKYFHWYDLGFIKISVLACSLLIAKLWPPILSLDWYYYLLIAICAAMRPMFMMLQKNQE